jgi:hypothetical protein
MKTFRSILAVLSSTGLLVSAAGYAAAEPQDAEAAKRFSPIVTAGLIDSICRASEGDGKGVGAFAEAAGLAALEAAPANLAWALPEGSRTWAAESLDGAVYVYGYGEEPLKCGVSIVRPITGVTAQLVVEQFAAAAKPFAVDSTQDMGAGVVFTRLKSADGRFIDILDYPRNGDAPGVLKVELLR